MEMMAIGVDDDGCLNKMLVRDDGLTTAEYAAKICWYCDPDSRRDRSAGMEPGTGSRAMCLSAICRHQ